MIDTRVDFSRQFTPKPLLKFTAVRDRKKDF